MMNIDLSKLCADFLRQYYYSQSNHKIKASHARELVAAFFGYKSHAALLTENAYPLTQYEVASIFIPDIPLMNKRRLELKNLPHNFPNSTHLAELLSNKLTNEGILSAEVWIYDSLSNYIAEVLLPDSQCYIDDELANLMAGTNAGFYNPPYFDNVKIEDFGDKVIANCEFKYKGKPLDNKPFCGDTLDVIARVILPRIAGKRGFDEFELEIGGSINDEWVDRELQYDYLISI